MERRSHLNQRIRVLGADPADAQESRLSCFPLSGGPGGSGQPSPPRRVAGAVGDSLAGGPRVSCDSAAGPLPPAAAGPFPERRGGGGRRGATIGARARGCGRTAFRDRRAGADGARDSSLPGSEPRSGRLAGSRRSAQGAARPAMRAAPEHRPPPRAARWACPGGGRRAPSAAAPGALRTRRSRARWQHVCGVRGPEAAGQRGDHARRHPEGEPGEAPERGPRRGGVGVGGSGRAVVGAGAGKPAEPFGACSARTKAPATAAGPPRGPGGLGGAARGRERSGPRDSGVAPPRRDPTRGSRSLECCAANSAELRPSRENLGTFRRGSARKEPVGAGLPQRSTRGPLPSAPIDAPGRGAGAGVREGEPAPRRPPAGVGRLRPAVHTDGRAVCIKSG